MCAIVIGSGPNGLVAASSTTCARALIRLLAASPAIDRLSLEDWGLCWMRGPLVVAHPALDGSCPALGTFAQTVATLGPGDREGWVELIDLWDRVGDTVLAGLTGPFPPVRAAGTIARRLRLAGIMDFARRLGE